MNQIDVTSQEYLVGFVILNYNSFDDLINCCESINKHCSSFYVVIVDNASKPDEQVKLRGFESKCPAERYHFIYLPTNLGFAKGNNAGFRYLKKNINCEFIAVINSDTLLLASHFETQISEAYEKCGFAVLGPDVVPGHTSPYLDALMTKSALDEAIKYTVRMNKILNFPILGWLWESLRFLKHKVTSPKKPVLKWDMEKFVLHGCFLVFSKLYILDGFPECTFLYAEENFLHRECLRHGLKMVYYPQIVIFHKGGSSTKKINGTELRSRRFLYKHSLDSLLSYKKRYYDELP